MKIKSLMSVLSVSFVLTACSGEETFHFEGESDNWSIEYVTDVVESDSSEKSIIIIKYIGENEAPKQIDYNIKGELSEMSGGDSPMQDGVLKTAGSTCSGCAVTNEDDEFDVTIEWDEKSERFTLKNEE